MRELGVGVKDKQLVVDLDPDHILPEPDLLYLEIGEAQYLMRALNYCLNYLGADHYKGLIPYPSASASASEKQ